MSDEFFFYGEDPERLLDEIRADVQAEVDQPRRTLFYFREFGAGVATHENRPTGVFFQVSLAFDIVRALARRNLEVASSALERRVAVSQNTIRIDTDQNGNVNVSVQYIPLAAAQQPKQLEVPGAP